MENSSSNNRFRSAVFNHDVPRQPKLASQPPASALCRSFGQRATSDIPGLHKPLAIALYYRADAQTSSASSARTPGPCRARLKQGL
ncbi:hypothetical protein INR49_017705, partial [Caranx melampygus]